MTCLQTARGPERMYTRVLWQLAMPHGTRTPMCTQVGITAPLESTATATPTTLRRTGPTDFFGPVSDLLSFILPIPPKTSGGIVFFGGFWYSVGTARWQFSFHMLKIRLQRVGRKNDPSFRVVVLESTQGPKAGKHIDQVGFYNAVTKQKTLDTEKAKYWISKGAQPSDTVYNMLVTAGALEGKKRNALPKKSPIKKDEPEAVVAPAPKESVATDAQVAETPTEVVEEAPVIEVPAPVEEVAVVAEEVSAPEEAPAPAPEETPAA